MKIDPHIKKLADVLVGVIVRKILARSEGKENDEEFGHGRQNRFGKPDIEDKNANRRFI